MREIEVKILGIDPAEIRKRLKKAGARKVFEGEISARFYDFPDGRIRKSGNHLRLRKFGEEKVELTFKRLKGRKNVKDNEETDVIVGSFEDADAVLRGIGLSVVRGYKKKRERYALGKIKYEIDKYPKIPPLVEVEAKSESPSRAKKELEKGVRIIGYEMKDTKPWNGFEVHRHYGKKL